MPIDTYMDRDAYLNKSRAGDALKLWYLDGMVSQLNEASAVLSEMESDSESISGDQAVMALRYGRQGGVGARAEDGMLPIPRSRQTKQARWDTKNLYAHIRISEKAILSSRGSRAAFANMLEAELEDALTDGRDMMARMVFGNNLGVMTLIADNWSHSAGVYTGTVQNTMPLYEGQIIDIVDISDTSAPALAHANTEALEILTVDHNTETITVAAADDQTTQINALVDGSTTFNAAIIQHGATDYELTGFDQVFTADNTLYNVDRTEHKWFNPTVIDHSDNGTARDISETLLQNARDEAERMAGGDINFWITSYGVKRAYQALLLSHKRLVEPMKLQGGYEALSYNGKPLTADKYAPKETMFGLDLATWKMYELEDWNWMDRDNVLTRVSGYPIWAAALAKYADMGCNKPRGNVKITGIKEH